VAYHFAPTLGDNLRCQAITNVATLANLEVTMVKTLICAGVLSLAGCGVGKVFGKLPSETPNEAPSAGPVVTTSVPIPATPIAISPDAPGCGRGQVVPATPAPLHFVFTLDRSGSMNDTDEANAAQRPTKWESLQAAMTAVFEDLGTAADRGDDSIAVGVNYFSEATSNNDGPESQVEWPLEALTRTRATALIQDIAGRNARGYTPTLAALTLSYDALQTFNPAGPLQNGTKVVILVSDGKPNPPPATPQTIPDLVQDRRDGTPAIRTFSIGIGEPLSAGQNGYEPGFMSAIAERGGTAKPGCDPNEQSDPAKFCHFQITPSVSQNITTDLVNAFTSIRQQVRTCELKLNIEKPAELEPRAVIVVAEKDNAPQRMLANDAMNGWTFDDPLAPKTILLHGTECDRLNSKDTKRVFAILGCACKLPDGTTPGGGGESIPGPGRQESQGANASGDWNTNWCSYPFVDLPGGACLGEGCPSR
jgi:hypothetical protein